MDPIIHASHVLVTHPTRETMLLLAIEIFTHSLIVVHAIRETFYTLLTVIMVLSTLTSSIQWHPWSLIL